MLRVIAFLCLLCVAASARAQDVWPIPRASSPEEVGLSSLQLGRLSAVMRQHVEANRLPGAVMLVARKGKIAWLDTIGWRDRDAKAPMTPDAMFRIYSMTKPITSVAVMMLAEEGKLQVYDPIAKHIPELSNLKVGREVSQGERKTLALDDPPRQPTVQDLLRHTSGFTYGTRGDSLVHDRYRDAKIGSRDDTNAEFVAKLGKLPLMYAPGTRWEYGVSTDVLGRLVEVVSGKSLGQFFYERIFNPLNMYSTSFWVDQGRLGRAAQPAQTPGGPPMTQRFDVGVKAKYESGGGGLVGSTSDYLRFALMLRNKGDLGSVRLLGSKTVEYMTADHLGTIPIDAPGLGFGLGFQVRRSTGIANIPGSFGEYGWAGNGGTLFWIDPQEDLIAILMITVSDHERVALRNQFRTMVQAAIMD